MPSYLFGCGLLLYMHKPFMMDNVPKLSKFSDEAIDNFATLFDILRQIHIRLLREGYQIEEDRIIPPDLKEG